MPTFQGQVSEEQLLALTEYIKSLPAGKSAPARSSAGQSDAASAGTQPAASRSPGSETNDSRNYTDDGRAHP